MNHLNKDTRNFYVVAGFVAGWILGLMAGLILATILS